MGRHGATWHVRSYGVFAMKHNIMNRMAVICVATAALTFPLLLVGCGDREVSHTESSNQQRRHG